VLTCLHGPLVRRYRRSVAKFSERKVRLARELPELVQTLTDEVAKLWHFSKLAFEEGKDEYLGEVAGKLRVLVCETRTNRPLLIGLMDEFGIDLGITVDGPPGWELAPGISAGDQVRFREWLDMVAFVCQTSEGQAQITKRQIILAWAQQTGSAHQDWALDEELVHFRRDDLITIGSRGPSVYWLRKITETVAQVADGVLERLTPERIEQRVREVAEGEGAIA
jgi:hypothetical protein